MDSPSAHLKLADVECSPPYVRSMTSVIGRTDTDDLFTIDLRDGAAGGDGPPPISNDPKGEDPRRPNRPRRPRRFRRFRRLKIIAILLFVALIPISWSYGSYLTAPGDEPASIRSVDWLRDHGFESIVNDAEGWYYSRNKPTGTKPARRDEPP